MHTFTSKSGMIFAALWCVLLLVAISGCSPAKASAARGTGSQEETVLPADAPSEPGDARVRRAVTLSGPEAPADPGPQAKAPQAQEAPAASATQQNIAACWLPLVERLQADNVAEPYVLAYFSQLPEYSDAPMAEKIKELYGISFGRKKPATPKTTPSLPPSSIYRNVVTTASVERCREFLERNEEVFARMEKKHGVPKEIVAALLYVETRLGTFLGKDNAFWSLACMANADRPEHVSEGIKLLPLTDEHAPWLQSKLTDKSSWAYKELLAFLAYCNEQGLNPHDMPGSVYGAIGICQFMPSNLLPYGDDGDGDGVVDLFSEPDAIFSVGKYLVAHGWKNKPAVADQRKVLKRYNNSTKYANTILALAASIQTGKLHYKAPDAAGATQKPAAPAPKKKAPAKKAPTKKAPAQKTAKAPSAQSKS